ncbi:MAG: ferrochelatase [Planctomycetota bacterium]|nr:MAG: ferrochelatase [Planctomycetota bacterium]
MNDSPFDAFLLVSFGGPEQAEDVMPFLERVVAGKNVPRERLEEVAAHYHHFGGRSPINDQNRALLQALAAEFARRGRPLPCYLGNRNWHPLLEETLAEMAAAGVRRAVAFITSAFGSYSGCRQYLEDIARARAAVGRTAPHIDRLPLCGLHPGYIDTMADRVREASARFPDPAPSQLRLVFTAHSIPVSMAETSPYRTQLGEACRLVAERTAFETWDLVYQSRSGPPHVPWLGPDVLDHLRAIATESPATGVLLCPIGFLSDHLEVLYDLDVEAASLASELGIPLVRAETAGTHPRFVKMIADLVDDLAAGRKSSSADASSACPAVCPPDCCPPPRRPSRG